MMKRLSKEYLDQLSSTTDDDIQWNWDGKSLRIDAVVKGPVGSLYEGGIFRFEVNLPYGYPFKPPEAKLLTKIYHPNVSNLAEPHPHSLCPCCIRDTWSPALTV